MTLTYRTDWTDDDDQLHVIYFKANKVGAQRLARKMSAKFHIAYVILTRDGKDGLVDIGQYVYAGGVISEKPDLKAAA